MPTFTAITPDRLDKTLAVLAGITRSAAQKRIEGGHVRVNDVVLESSKHAVMPGDVITHDADTSHDAPQAEAIALDVIYEDDAILVINKPAGMSVHPGAGVNTGTVVNALLAHAPDAAGAGDDERPGIVHRLDKETSGVMVLAKTSAALEAMQAQFKTRSIQKTYLALCVGVYDQPRGLINKPIGRHPVHRQRMAVMPDGREAVTLFEFVRVVLVGDARYALLSCQPRTGRTHQLRVHLASIGLPVVGDAFYGGAAGARDGLSRKLTPRHLLHAQRLQFAHPVTGAPCDFSAPLAEDFQKIIGTEIILPPGGREDDFGKDQ